MSGKAQLQGTLLVLLSVLFTLGIAEISLRLFYPEYDLQAGARFEPDSLRITSRPANTRRTVHHPDNGKTHLVIYNNYGLRQHRDILQQDLDDAVT